MVWGSQAVVIKTRKAETVLQPLEQGACYGSDDEVGDAYGEENLRVLEGVGGDDLPFAGEFHAGDHVSQRGILDEVDDLITAPWKLHLTPWHEVHISQRSDWTPGVCRHP